MVKQAARTRRPGLAVAAMLASCQSPMGSGSTSRAGSSPSAAVVEVASNQAARLRRRLESVRVTFGLPAVAGAYVTSNGKIVLAVSGVRKFGTSDPAQTTDLFHLGSVTKPFTATLAAVLVQKGRISWDTTIHETLRDLAADVHPDHGATTLEQLLRHRAGLPPFEDDSEWTTAPKFRGSAAEKRRDFVRWLLTRPPATPPGAKHQYSNAGYSVAAVMLEKATGRSWEELMAQELLGPLGVARFGFGWPIETGRPGTWGHRGGKSIEPHDPARDLYRLEDLYIGPASDLSMDIEGIARFARLHLLGLEGSDQLLSAKTIQALHTTLSGDSYALGWNAFTERSTHLGSAETAFAALYLMRARRLAMVVMTNVWSPAEAEFGAALLKAVLDAATSDRRAPP